MIRNSKEFIDLLVNKAVDEAARSVITFASSGCENYNAEEGRYMVEYLRKCKKAFSQKIDEAIVSFQKWR